MISDGTLKKTAQQVLDVRKRNHLKKTETFPLLLPHCPLNTGMKSVQLLILIWHVLCRAEIEICGKKNL